MHLLRELTYFEELSEETKTWAGPLKELLLEMKGEVERARGEGGKRLAEEKLALLTQSYDRLVAEGLRAQPPPEVPEPVKKQARNLLLLRLERRKEEVLRFLHDLCVPFENNQAERDLRMIKLQQKTWGAFAQRRVHAGSAGSEATSRRCASKAEGRSKRSQGRAGERR